MDVINPRGRSGRNSPIVKICDSSPDFRISSFASRASITVAKVERPSQATSVPATVAVLRMLSGASSLRADFNASGQCTDFEQLLQSDSRAELEALP